MGCIGDIELLGCGGIPSYPEVDSGHSIGGVHGRILDGTGFIGMFKGHFVGVVSQPVELAIGSDRFIADIDPGAKPWKVDIYPIGVFGDSVEITAILDNIGIDGIFEGIWEIGAVERLVLMRGEIDLKITPAFWRIVTITGE